MTPWQSKWVNVAIAAVAVVAAVVLPKPQPTPVVFPPAVVVPAVTPDVPAPQPPPAAIPELVIVTDADGKRITDKAIEEVAGKLAVGSWFVKAIPKPGEIGWTRAISVAAVDQPIPVPPAPVPPGPPGPTPPIPPPVPPEPTPPPVVSGKRSLLIVHESADDAPWFSRIVNGIQGGPQAAYMKEKGHTLSLLQTDDKNEHGQSPKAVEAWRPFYADLKSPVLLIIDPATKTLLHREALTPTATADSIVATVKGKGG